MCPQSEPAPLSRLSASSPQKQDRHLPCPADPPDQLEATLTRQHDIQQYAIDSDTLQRRSRGSGAEHSLHLETICLQEVAHQLHDRQIVVDDQDLSLIGQSPLQPLAIRCCPHCPTGSAV